MRSPSLAVLPNDAPEVAGRHLPTLPVLPQTSPDALPAGAPPAASPSVLSPSEERDLLALARVALPAGKKLPGAGPQSVAKFHDGLRRAEPALALAYRAALRTLSGMAWVRYRRAIADLEPGQLESLLNWLYEGGFARRSFVRGLLSPLKASYFDDPAIFALLGQPYRGGHVSEEEVQRRVTPVDQPRYVKERTQSASDLADGETIECDVVVIGSGAGGAVAAYELAAAGQAVVILEEGLFFGRQDFIGSTFQMQRLLYRDMGLTVAFGNGAIVVPVGRTVGGTTTVNSGTCYRMPERIFRSWQERHGLTDYTVESLAPYYERVESVLGVDVAGSKFLGGGADAIARGAERLGFRHNPLRRNAPECDGQGLCCFGCPSDAKRSTNVSYVPMALQAGANLIVGAHAERLIVENGRAVGVEAVSRFPKEGTQESRPRFRVRARSVVVAGGSLFTPLMLLSDPVARKALGRSEQLGENLTIHPAAGMFAVLPKALTGPAIPQGYAVEHFHDEGLLMEGAFAPPDLTSVTMTIFGKRFMETMEAFDRMSCFGFMIEDSGHGRVRPGPTGRPLISYSLTEHDCARLKRGIDLVSQIYFAADAERVVTPVRGYEVLNNADELARFRQARLRPDDFELSAYHPLGTARMGVDPKKSVVGPDLQAHDLPGLYICDGSVLPTSPAVNPQLTIMAVATRAAQQLASKLS